MHRGVEDISVGVFAYVREPENPERLALVHHAYGQQKWSLPGGQLEQGEMASVGVAREVLEETGFMVRLHQLVGIFPLKKKPGLVILYEVTVVGGEINPQDTQEITECRFFSEEEAFNQRTDIYPAQQAMIALAEAVRLGAIGTPTEGYLVPPASWQTPIE